MNGRALVCPRRMHCMYGSMAKGTSHGMSKLVDKPSYMDILATYSWNHPTVCVLKVIADKTIINHNVKIIYSKSAIQKASLKIQQQQFNKQTSCIQLKVQSIFKRSTHYN